MTASSRLDMDCNWRYDGEVTVGCMLLWDLEYSPYLKVTVWRGVSCWHHVGASTAGRAAAQFRWLGLVKIFSSGPVSISASPPLLRHESTSAYLLFLRLLF